MNVLTTSKVPHYSGEVFYKEFTCWIGLPINQKENVCFQVTPDMTFESLFQTIMHGLFPNESIASDDYYFLNIRPEQVVRVQMGEFVSSFAESPRFLLRHNEHGLQGAVINETVSLERLDQSFLRIQTVEYMEEHNLGLFSELQLDSLRIAAQDTSMDGSVSIGELITDEDVTEKKVRLPAESECESIS